MQHNDLVADAMQVWHDQAQELPSGALLLHIDATPFSGSKATETAVLHLRAVTIACPADQDRNELLLAQLKVARTVDEISLKAAEEMIGWVWPRYAGAAGSIRGSGPSAPETPAGRHMRPRTPPAPKRAAPSARQAPHDRFCTMVYNMKFREPTSQPDLTELDTYADVMGPFVLPWSKYVIMDNGLYPQNTPPKLHMPPVGATRRAFPQSLFPRDIGLTEPYSNVRVARALTAHSPGDWPHPEEIMPPFSDIAPRLPRLPRLPDLADRDPLDPLNSPLARFSELQAALPILETPGAEDRTTDGLASTSPIPDDPPHSCSESIMTEFLAEFINSFVSLSQRFNPSKYPAYTSFSHQRQFGFGPGRGPRQPPNGSFNARVDGYMVRPGRPFSVWIIHEVKQATRAKSNPQLQRQETCELAAWAYESRAELRAELGRTRYADAFPRLLLA